MNNGCGPFINVSGSNAGVRPLLWMKEMQLKPQWLTSMHVYIFSLKSPPFFFFFFSLKFLFNSGSLTYGVVLVLAAGFSDSAHGEHPFIPPTSSPSPVLLPTFLPHPLVCSLSIIVFYGLLLFLSHMFFSFVS